MDDLLHFAGMMVEEEEEKTKRQRVCSTLAIFLLTRPALPPLCTIREDGRGPRMEAALDRWNGVGAENGVCGMASWSV